MSDQQQTDGHREYAQVTEDVLRPMQGVSIFYFLGLGITGMMLCWGLVSFAYQFRFGMGTIGLMHPMMWATYITNFVFWIGIAHSGTLISAILFLFRAPFRPAFSRATEAMTIIAIITAGAFPLVHLGRTWRAYWLIPYPNERGLWINFRSPLILDVFAVSTYFTVSLIFFWIGFAPDVAIIRDRSTGWKRTIYGVLALGWHGNARQWKHYLMAYSILASLATPLVLSVHSVVSWDFALALVPGWHSTIFAPYFVAGAIFSGLAMVLTLLIPLRVWLRLERYITIDRLEAIGVLLLFMSLIVSYSYAQEYFMTYYGQDDTEIRNLLNKTGGWFSVLFWIMTVCNVAVPLALFWRKVRRSITWLFLISLFVNLGMWLERFVIIAGSLARDYDPYSWAPRNYHPTWVEIGVSVGALGWFVFAFLLFSKLLPVLPIAETKQDLLKEHLEEQAVEAAKGEAR